MASAVTKGLVPMMATTMTASLSVKTTLVLRIGSSTLASSAAAARRITPHQGIGGTLLADIVGAGSRARRRPPARRRGRRTKSQSRMG